MNSIPTDVGKLILDELSIRDLGNFLKTNKALKDTYLNNFADRIEQAKPKTGKFKDSETSLKFKLYPALEYHDIHFDEGVEDGINIAEDTVIYGQMVDINPSLPSYSEILVADVPFVIRAFNGTGFFYDEFKYKLYSGKREMYREAMKDAKPKFTFGPGGKATYLYMFEGENVDLYFFNYSGETSAIDRCEIVFGVK